MAASYPSSAKTFTTKSNATTSDASHINDVQVEITAIEQDLIAGLPVARGGTGAISLSANRVAHANAGGTALTGTAGLTFDGTTLAVPGQIAFPATQNASTDANTMDDYEEGTFTAGLSFGGGTTGITYAAGTTGASTYVKWGKNVIVAGYVELSSKGSSSGAAVITGLPFANEAANRAAYIGTYANFSGLTGSLIAQVDASGSGISLHQSGAAASGTVTDAAFTNTTYAFFSGFYRAAA